MNDAGEVPAAFKTYHTTAELSATTNPNLIFDLRAKLDATAIKAAQDELGYVNSVIMGKLLESQTLRQKAANNTKEQFANSPDLKSELLNAIMESLDAHTSMSTQALNSRRIQDGMRGILLSHSHLYEALSGKM